MTAAPEARVFLVCEGNNDKAVLEGAAKEAGVAVIVERMKGKGGLKDNLDVVADGHTLRSVNTRALAVFLDANGDAKAEEENATAAMREVFGCSDDFPHGEIKPLEVRGRRMSAGVFIMPGGGRPGALETMILESIRDKFPDAMACVRDFRECARKACKGPVKKEAKKKAQAMLSALPEHCLNFIDMIEAGKIDFSDSAFKELRDFLLALKKKSAES